ncbi:hypothetical protein CRUP_023345 [Coryphaenoides rupestris]|nr:hypothetical protein CRUP_023345 [Coryphaenoides rupestris]
MPISFKAHHHDIGGPWGLTVNLQVRRPLSPTHLSPEQVGLEMLCLCRQLDLLVRAQVQQYFPHLAKLNQLLVLSQQLEEDVRHLGSHKYIVHQLSVLYRDIKANFKQMKVSLATEEGSRLEPQLAAHYVNWILKITEHIASVVSALPEDLMEDLSPAMSFISQLLIQQPLGAPKHTYTHTFSIGPLHKQTCHY